MPCEEGSDAQLKSLKPLGTEVLAMPKFWVLYLTLAGLEKLENGMQDISGYIEDVDENRKALANFLQSKEDEKLAKQKWFEDQEEVDSYIVGETSLA